jgi:hypothetical protein
MDGEVCSYEADMIHQMKTADFVHSPLQFKGGQEALHEIGSDAQLHKTPVIQVHVGVCIAAVGFAAAADVFHQGVQAADHEIVGCPGVAIQPKYSGLVEYLITPWGLWIEISSTDKDAAKAPRASSVT